MNIPMLMAVNPTHALILLEPPVVEIEFTIGMFAFRFTKSGAAPKRDPRSECAERSEAG